MITEKKQQKKLIVLSVRGSGDQADELVLYRILRGLGIVPNVVYDRKTDVVLVYLRKDADMLNLASRAVSVHVPRVLRIDGFSEFEMSSDIYQETKVEKVLRTMLDLADRDWTAGFTKRTITINLDLPTFRNDVMEQVLGHLTGQRVYVTMSAKKRVNVWTTAQGAKVLDSVDLTKYFDSRFTYVCPVCGLEVESLTDLQMHYFLSHDVSLCPLDGNPADYHMFSNVEHLPYALLTYFTVNRHKAFSEMYRISYFLARFTFNKVDHLFFS